MTNAETNADIHYEERAQSLERWLLTEFGPVLSGANLRKLLGYPSSDAFRQALHRHGPAVALFMQPGKRGWCASTREVAYWIARSETTYPAALLPGQPAARPSEQE